MLFHYLFRLFCFEYKIVSIEYFMDKMQSYEIDMILDNISFDKRVEWEQIRMLGYVFAQTQCTKKLDITDIMRFEWDKIDANDTSISNKQIEHMHETAKYFEDMFKNKNIKNE